MAFVSKSLTAVQLKWSTIQTEAYAIFICCTQLGYLLRDRPFTLHTDEQNLTFMTVNSSSMVGRWYIAIQEFHYTIHFVKGSQNTIADALSQLCPNLAELALPLQEPATPEPGQLLLALHVVPTPDDDQLEALQMCHNSVVGHGGYRGQAHQLGSQLALHAPTRQVLHTPVPVLPENGQLPHSY
jgi:RNase H-like domain found in reverse transcriptase